MSDMPVLARWRIAVTCVALAASSAFVGCSKYDGPAEIERARSSGTAVSAIIVSAEDTHSRRDASHYVRFKLRLQKDGAERVIESMTLVNPYDFQRYPPGASVRCRVLDDNPEYFAFVE